jgi:hypothetical protein
MALGIVQLQLDASELTKLRESLGKIFDNKGLARTLEAALKKAIKPAEERLRQITPVGPTENLRNAVSSKSKAYEKDGSAVGLVGYRQSTKEPSTPIAGARSVRKGKNRGFHQWWLEFGTKEREVTKVADKPYTRRAHQRRMRSGVIAEINAHQVKGQGAVIASSFIKRGQVFNDDGSLKPYAFFKKGKKGVTAISVGSTPAGGKQGVPPVQTALRETQPQIAAILEQELRISLERAVSSIAFASTGTVGGIIGE